jgi:hypothetical protein
MFDVPRHGVEYALCGHRKADAVSVASENENGAAAPF